MNETRCFRCGCRVKASDDPRAIHAERGHERECPCPGVKFYGDNSAIAWRAAADVLLGRIGLNSTAGVLYDACDAAAKALAENWKE